MDKRKILIVDRDPDVTSEFAGFLQDERHEIVTARDGPGCQEMLKREKIDLAVVEVCVEDKDGITLLEGMTAEKTGRRWCW